MIAHSSISILKLLFFSALFSLIFSCKKSPPLISGLWTMDYYSHPKVDNAGLPTKSMIEIREDSLFIHEHFDGPLNGYEISGKILSKNDSIIYLPLEEIKWSNNAGILYYIKKNCWNKLTIYYDEEKIIVQRILKRRFTHLTKRDASRMVTINLEYKKSNKNPSSEFIHYPIMNHFKTRINEDEISKKTIYCNSESDKQNYNRDHPSRKKQ